MLLKGLSQFISVSPTFIFPFFMFLTISARNIFSYPLLSENVKIPIRKSYISTSFCTDVIRGVARQDVEENVRVKEGRY